jgi:dolichyl-phosphate-mannose-protein mannosyltransferase
LLFGLAGWFVGFDGEFSFENIGDSYSENHVPFVGMRALPAIMGSLTIPVVYAIMKESGYSTVVAAFSASLVLFGEPPIRMRLSRALTYFILRQCSCGSITFDTIGRGIDFFHVSDHLLIYSIPEASISVRIRFTTLCVSYSPKLREFTVDWWGWLIATGVFMACTWGSKVNGILTVFTIGIAVLIELWDILDIKKGHTMVRLQLHSRLDSKPSFIGPFQPTLFGKGRWLNHRAIYTVPVILLGPLYRPHSFWPWRHLHEPSFPRDVDWE